MTLQAGFVDLQVNGFAGIDFNDDELTTERIHQACVALRAGGVAGVLATVITDEIPAMCRRLSNLRRACEEQPLVAEVVWGLHIEGPFLNEQPGYIGAHPPAAAQVANIDAMNQLLDAAGGLTKLVTLAPERDPGLNVTRLLADRGIRVAAGHCDPSLAQLREAIDAGLSLFTHLGNGCPLMMHRHDNIVQRVLSLAEHLWIAFIADGVHVPWPALGNYLKITGWDRVVVVTDATAAAGQGPGLFQLAGQTLRVDQNGATWSADGSHLVGSAAAMSDIAQNLRQHLGLSEPEIDRLVDTNPREYLFRTGEATHAADAQ